MVMSGVVGYAGSLALRVLRALTDTLGEKSTDLKDCASLSL